MKTIRELYKENLEETVESYGHKARVQGRWVRLQAKKQVEKVEEIVGRPRESVRKLTDDLQHDVEALKRFYQTQKKEISKLTKNLIKNKDKLLEKSKVFSSLKGETPERKVKVVSDSDVA